MPSGGQISALNSSTGASCQTQTPSLVGVLIDMVELEVLELAAPSLEEDASLGNRITLLVEHADADGAAGLHQKSTGPIPGSMVSSFTSVARPLAETTIRVVRGSQPASR